MSKISEIDYQEYLELINDGHSQRSACKILGLKRSTLQDYIKRKQKEMDCVKQEVLNGIISNDYSNWITKEKPPIRFDVVDDLKEQKPLSKTYGFTKEKVARISLNTQKAYMSKYKKKPTILVIADTQCKPTESLEYMLWIGNYIDKTKPDVVVNIGDTYDMPSLSSYDKGKASAEGRRFVDDLHAGNKGLELLNTAMHKDPSYKPRKVFCKGNHEHRIDRYAEDNPELKGTIGTEFLPLEKYGWEVYDFLKPVEIEGIYFLHYLANPMTGKPYAGTAANILKTVGKSFVVGHKQVLDLVIRPTFDGKQQIGIVNGACYPFEESYKGYFGNVHYRGVTVLTEVHDGFGLPSFISLDYMKEKYYE